jgi:hypothetical protein
VTYISSGLDPNAESWAPDIALGTLDDECLEIPAVKPTTQSWPGDGMSWVKTLWLMERGIFWLNLLWTG